jgi:hypothetical protein
MAWTYADYEEQPTDAARLARLRQHITEVGQQIQANRTSGDQKRENDALMEYLDRVLAARRRELEAAAANGGRFARGRCT